MKRNKIMAISLAAIFGIGLTSCANVAKTTSSTTTHENVSDTTTTTKSTNTTNTTIINPVDDTKTTSNSDTTVTDDKKTSTTTVSTTTTTSTTTVSNDENDATPTIFLAGDSTVKTYNDNQYIGGWGQFLDLYLDDNITVKNCAQGGRSSRSFINEGRLYDNENSTYTFSENGGNSIGDEIKEGDFLFIQFGHNDDSTKAANSLAERMVPLGEADENGIYPVTPAEKTTIVRDSSGYATEDSVSDVVKEGMSSYSSELTSYLKNSVSKYGDSYYEYGSGTYKWYLKQYIDFAREKGATPVLVTPVSRVKFDSTGTIIGGAGLHGENFAYVQAVRQLASEEDCLLIDLFAKSKTLLETATPSYANYLMALKPNSLTGEWPLGFDMTYGNTSLGYEGYEATHYNQYGAFIEAAYVAEEIITSTEKCDNGERFNFKDNVNETPEKFVEPSNLIPKSIVSDIESTYTDIVIKNPNRVYNDAADVVTLIDNLEEVSNITEENYETVKAAAEEANKAYYGLNVDDKASVTNYSKLKEVFAKVEEIEASLRPVATSTVVFNASDVAAGTYTEGFTSGDFTFSCTTDKTITSKACNTTKTYNGTDYTFTNYLSFGGNYQKAYVTFEIKGNCTITVIGASTNSSTARVFGFYNASGKSIGQVDAETSLAANSIDIESTGETIKLGSTSGGVYIYGIIIEYFD